jgi:hypothetical protein
MNIPFKGEPPTIFVDWIFWILDDRHDVVREFVIPLLQVSMLFCINKVINIPGDISLSPP